MNRSRWDMIDKLRNEIKLLKLAHIEDIARVRKEVAKKERAKCAVKVRTAIKNRTKKVKPVIKAQAKVIRKKASMSIKKKAVYLADKRVQYLRMKNVVYIDGALCFPVLIGYARTLDLTPVELQHLILINLFKEGRPAFFEQYGLDKKTARYALSSLAEKGYAEVFGERNPVYAPSLKGKRAFLDFREYYRQIITRGVYNEKLTTRHPW